MSVGLIHIQATLTLLGLCSISTNAKKLLLQILHNNCCITHLKMSWMHRDKVVNLDAVEFLNENTLNFRCNNKCQALIRNSYTSTNDQLAESNGPITASKQFEQYLKIIGLELKYHLQGLPGSISAGRSHALHCVAEGRSCQLSQILSIDDIILLLYHIVSALYIYYDYAIETSNHL